MEDLDKRAAAHDTTVTQMNERLGNIEATLREVHSRLAGMALRTEVHWAVGLAVGWLTTIIVVAVGILLKYR